MNLNDQLPEQPWSLRQKDMEFIDRLLTYSLIATNRETSHSINNLLTSLTIYVSMLKNNLTRGKIDKAFSSIESIEKSLNNITAFTGKLSKKISYPFGAESVFPNLIIKDSLELCKRVFGLSDWSHITDFCEMEAKINIDISIIQILLVTWFATNLNLYNHPAMKIRTSWDEDRMQFDMSCTVTEKSGDVITKIIPRESGVGCGEIPLITMKRIIHSNCPSADVIIPRNDNNDFTLSLTAS